MSPANKVKLGIVGIIAIIIFTVFVGMVGKNEDTQFVIKQPVHQIFGDMQVIDRGGYYFKGFSTVWTWNKFEDLYFSQVAEEGSDKDESVIVTFNDGGKGKVSTYIRVQLPTSVEERIEFNRQFSGNRNNIRSSIRSHLNNCLKSTAPIMSSSEHQSARYSEFDQTVQEQLINGLYAMAKEAVATKDITDEKGEEVTVYVTKLLRDEAGMPIIAKESPLSQYGINVVQFSLTDVEYDERTRELFAAKKESSLLAEKSKAERIQETQQRLMVIEKGLREKAEVEAKANVDRAEAVIKV